MVTAEHTWRSVGIINNDWPTPQFVGASPWDLGNSVRLEPIQDWVRSESILRPLGAIERSVIAGSAFAIATDYSAAGDDAADQESSPQTRARRALLQAVTALWIVRPSAAGVRLFLDAEQRANEEWVPRSISSHARLVLHTRDVETRLTDEDVSRAREVNQTISSLPAESAVAVAHDTVFQALHTRAWQLRYLLLWIALEALFGAENPAEVSYRLGYRLALFIRGPGGPALELFRQAKRGYGFRSAIVHGFRSRSLRDGESDELMGNVETWTREALLKILADPKYLAIFSTKKRDEYLDEIGLGAP